MHNAHERSMSLVEFTNVTCAYDGRPALDDLSLSVAKGEALALVGRSGAGKSTLLKLVNRLLIPQQGSVMVDGRDTRDWDPGLPPSDFAARWPGELSGGQQQRVGVARALAANPPVLLMDEPFGALDPVTRAELQGAFATIQRDLGQTVLLVTHDIGEACRLGTRVGVLDEGSLVVCDAPSVVSRSADTRVRRLLDSARTVPVP
jgi:osmoprotectant transport system ATP-binding protein